ncbi:MAG TPA: sulfate ABC transporter ATP-binding protein [Chloroflexota bacterium]|nr:sulfate ABC transporter ATP-binding protein [Chloroflexota bacterium]
MNIDVRNLVKTFGAFTALRDVSLEVPDGHLVALLGPSGCGKTTLLRIIAGLDVADSGAILFGGDDVGGRSVKERNVGFVFQHYALFRHMTIFENVAFGLRVRPRRLRPSEAQIRAKVNELLALIQVEWLAHRYPAQLSGGQRQRVALARALAVEPRVLLLDEPFGALDAKVRGDLRRWLRQLHYELRLTAVLVTHDQEEALEVADRVVVMNEGRVEQVGTPEEVYDHPASSFVYDFLGRVNLFHARVHDGQAHVAGLVLDAGGEASVVGYARPHDLVVERAAPGEEGGLTAMIARIQTIGPVVRLELRHTDGSNRLEAEMSKERFQELNLAQGEVVVLTPRNVRLFPASASIGDGVNPG